MLFILVLPIKFLMLHLQQEEHACGNTSFCEVVVYEDHSDNSRSRSRRNENESSLHTINSGLKESLPRMTHPLHASERWHVSKIHATKTLN